MKHHINAFTLAEVLITLGIIGVVAAMTMPSLIQKYKEKVWLNQFKTTYSILSQAYLSAYQEYGLPEEWGLSTNSQDKDSIAKASSYLFKYLKLANDFKQNDKNSSNGLPVHYKDLDGTNLGTNFNGWNGRDYVVVLTNGAVIGINSIGYIAQDANSQNKKFLVSMYIDTNGVRGPNQFGKDFFFIYLNSHENYPVITGYPLWWISEKNCSTKTTSGWYSGGACATWIIKNWNMDYLHRELTHDEWIN